MRLAVVSPKKKPTLIVKYGTIHKQNLAITKFYYFVELDFKTLHAYWL